jgi:hypothetical protein
MWPHRHGGQSPYQLAKPPADTIALGRGAVFLGDSKTHPDWPVIIAAAALNDEGGRSRPRTTSNGEEVRPLP